MAAWSLSFVDDSNNTVALEENSKGAFQTV